MKNFIEEIEWRGMIHDKMPDIEKHLKDHFPISAKHLLK